MKKLLIMWLFVWFLIPTVSSQAEEQITRLPQLMDCGSVATIGKRLSAMGQMPFLQSDASMQIPAKQVPKIIFGEVMIFMNQDTNAYSMVFKLPDALRAKGGPDLCIFGVGHKLRPVMSQPAIETIY